MSQARGNGKSPGTDRNGRLVGYQRTNGLSNARMPRYDFTRLEDGAAAVNLTGKSEPVRSFQQCDL